MNITSKSKEYITTTLHISVLVFSILLIVYISYDTFNNIPFLQNHNYMQFQLWVCVLFMLSFFVELLLTDHKWRYIKHNFLFFLVSIPYLNIISNYNIDFSNEELYFIRFIPLVRGAFALSIVLGYISTNRISSIFASYLAIMISVVYFSSLIFYEREFPVNNQLKDYGDALWWACMNVTTLGAPITPVTNIGKIMCVVLGGFGMMMFPMFTVYFTNILTDNFKKRNSNNSSKR